MRKRNEAYLKDKIQNQMPGPGAYDAKYDFSSLNQGPRSFKMRARPKVSILLMGRDPQIPDLGTYEYIPSIN